MRMHEMEEMPQVVTLHNDVNMLADMTGGFPGQPEPEPMPIPLDVPESAIRGFDARMEAIERHAAHPVQMTPGGKPVGRNDPCPCGSGKKYKKCCGRGL
jgi:preprotein translocase subunit SecA